MTAFLHRLDSLTGEAQLVETNAAALRSATFLDGRETFWAGSQVVNLAPPDLEGSTALRYIFHMGFCGSTLLARLLDRPGHVLALKEPQCLADLSSQRSAITMGHAIASFEKLADHTVAALARAGAGEIVLVKPSSWINGMLTRFCSPERVGRAVFMTMGRRQFLRAAFRGGRDRLAFCARLAADMASGRKDGESLLLKATGRGDDPLDQTARIVALLHALQEDVFARTLKRREWPPGALVDHAELISDTHATLARVRSTLDLPAAAEWKDFGAVLSRHAKDRSQGFSTDQRLSEDREIERHHAGRFDIALSFVEEAGFPARL